MSKRWSEVLNPIHLKQMIIRYYVSLRQGLLGRFFYRRTGVCLPDRSSPRKILYFHIGMGKTGTTALQNFFWSNRDRLAEYGICYPNYGIVACAHHILSPHVPEFLRNVWNFEAISDWAPKLFSAQQDVLLLSSELVAWADPEKVANFCETGKKWFDMKVVIYLRRQDNLIMAGYNQQIKAGTLKRDISIVIEKQFDRFNYEEKLRPWENALGEENIIVRPYERQQFYKQDIRMDFLHNVFGIDDFDTFDFDQNNANPRLSVAAMEYKRLINCLIDDTSVSNQFNPILLDYSASTDQSSADIFSESNLLSAAERLRIIDCSERINRMIARRYLRRKDGRLFYDSKPCIEGVTKNREITHQDLSDITMFIKKNNEKLYRFLIKTLEQKSGSSNELIHDAFQKLRGTTWGLKNK